MNLFAHTMHNFICGGFWIKSKWIAAHLNYTLKTSKNVTLKRSQVNKIEFIKSTVQDLNTAHNSHKVVVESMETSFLSIQKINTNMHVLNSVEPIYGLFLFFFAATITVGKTKWKPEILIYSLDRWIRLAILNATVLR